MQGEYSSVGQKTTEPLQGWKPLLAQSEVLSQTSWETIHSIVRDLENCSQLRERAGPGKISRLHEPAILYTYLAVATRNSSFYRKAMHSLNRAIGFGFDLTTLPALHGGLAGLGWSVEHLCRLSRRSGDSFDHSNFSKGADSHVHHDHSDDLLADVDELLLSMLNAERWPGHFDLINGLVGLGVYFIERLPRPAAKSALAAIVRHLRALSEQQPTGTTWHTPHRLVTEIGRARYPNGYYNLGVAHGVPGVLSFLWSAYLLGIETEVSLTLLERTMEWLIKQQMPADSGFRFPAHTTSVKKAPSRFTWCYGDLGVLSAISPISIGFDTPSWTSFSSDLYEHCLRQALIAKNIVDAPLCHGASGIAHILNRLFQRNGDERCKSVAIAWYEKTLLLCKPSGGIGGVSTWTRPEGSIGGEWTDNPALLAGAIGVALALLAAVTDVEPAWDRLLLISSKALEERLSTY